MGFEKKCENEKRNLYGICSLNGMYNLVKSEAVCWILVYAPKHLDIHLDMACSVNMLCHDMARR
jgi:hypothetical protein